MWDSRQALINDRWYYKLPATLSRYEVHTTRLPDEISFSVTAPDYQVADALACTTLRLPNCPTGKHRHSFRIARVD
jgi:hypothetical protein